MKTMFFLSLKQQQQRKESKRWPRNMKKPIADASPHPYIFTHEEADDKIKT